MRITFMAVYYYEGPVRYLYRIFEIYKALGKVFSVVGYDVRFLAKQNEVLPLQKTYSKEETFDAVLNDTDLLFMWNGGLGKEKEMAEKARKRGIPIYFSELGWMPQGGTFYFDRKGVNRGSSITDWTPRVLSPEEQEWTRTKLAFYHNKNAQKTGLLLANDPFVFVPFQVENDSQIVQYSPSIKKMQDLVDLVAANVPKSTRIYFKRHPKHDPGEIKLPANARLFTGGTTHDFLTHPGCKYVITINSTVGLEALSYNKPVITLGESFYHLLTYDADAQNLGDAISWAEAGDVALGHIQSFMHYLFKKQWVTEDLKNPRKVLGLIENLTDLG